MAATNRTLTRRGRVSPSQVLETAYPGMKDSEREAATARRKIEGGRNATLYVRGGGLTPGVSLHFAHCCSPVPGDRIVGILREDGEGLDVHTIDCPRLAEFEDREELWRDLNWTPEAERSTISLTRLHATIQNAPGVLGLVCTAGSDRHTATDLPLGVELPDERVGPLRDWLGA